MGVKSQKERGLRFALVLIIIAILTIFLLLYFIPHEGDKVFFKINDPDNLYERDGKWYEVYDGDLICRDDKKEVFKIDIGLNHPMAAFGRSIYIASSRGNIRSFSYDGKEEKSVDTGLPIEGIYSFQNRLYILGGTGIFLYDEKLNPLEEYPTEAQVVKVMMSPREDSFFAIELGTRDKEIRSSFSIYSCGRTDFRMTHLNEAVLYGDFFDEDKFFYATDKALYLYENYGLEKKIDIDPFYAIASDQDQLVLAKGGRVDIYDKDLNLKETIKTDQVYEYALVKNGRIYLGNEDHLFLYYRGRHQEIKLSGLKSIKSYGKKVYLIYSDGIEEKTRFRLER